jgi:hypothetical protein
MVGFADGFTVPPNVVCVSNAGVLSDTRSVTDADFSEGDEVYSAREHHIVSDRDPAFSLRLQVQSRI